MTLKEVLDRCSLVASFCGTPVTSTNQKNVFGDTPLHVVSTWNELKAVNVLLEHGANVNAIGERGQTALYSAVLTGNASVVQALLDYGADTSLRDDDGNTAEQFATQRGLTRIAQMIRRTSRRHN